jgi:hypothetical protein
MRGRLAVIALLFVPAILIAQGRAGAIFTGSVVDSVQHPIANADVSLPGLSLNAVTKDDGTFRFTDIPAGIHRIIVRRIGYGLLDTLIIFAEGQTVARRITLGRIVMLDSVLVVDAKTTDPAMAAFEANRARGFGSFLTRTELDKKEGQTLGSVMQQLSGLDVVRGSSGQAWVTGKRAPMSRCPPTSTRNVNAAAAIAAQAETDRCLRSERLYYVPEDYESRQNMKRTCYSVVYLDRSLMNAGRPTPPFDLNTLTPDRLEAIEWYADAAQVPPQYNARDSGCGVAVLHTHRPR